MIGRDRRYGKARNASLKARLGIATAVLVGGGAIGVAAVAASSHSAPAPAKSAGFAQHEFRANTLGSYWVNGSWSTTAFFSGGHMRHHHTWHHGYWAQYNTGSLLSAALTQWQWSHNNAFNLFARLSNRDTQATFHHTTFAEQRGIVVLATHHFLIVRSFDGTLRLWLLSGGTRFSNVSSTWTGTNALTGGNTFVTNQAMSTNGSMTPIAQLLAGSLGQAQQMVTPVAHPTTIAVNVAGTGITVQVTVTVTTATVTQTTPTSTTTTLQNPFAFTQNVQRGDLVLVAGVRSHGLLHAALVAFTPLNSTMIPTTTTPTTPTVPVPGNTMSGTHS